MRLRQFINLYDKIDSIVLLEGKRNVPESDRLKVIQLGKLLASSTKNMTFRSGNADGADYLFALGITHINNNRLQVIKPYTKHRENKNLAYKTFSLDKIDIKSQPQIVYQSKKNKIMEKLIEQYVAGDMMSLQTF